MIGRRGAGCGNAAFRGQRIPTPPPADLADDFRPRSVSSAPSPTPAASPRRTAARGVTERQRRSDRRGRTLRRLASRCRWASRPARGPGSLGTHAKVQAKPRARGSVRPFLISGDITARDRVICDRPAHRRTCQILHRARRAGTQKKTPDGWRRRGLDQQPGRDPDAKT